MAAGLTIRVLPFFLLNKNPYKKGTCPLNPWMFPENLELVRWVGKMLPCYQEVTRNNFKNFHTGPGIHTHCI